MGSKQTIEMPEEIQVKQTKVSEAPMDILFSYAKNNENLDIAFVKDLHLQHLKDESLCGGGYNTNKFLCQAASSQNILNLLKVLVCDLQIKEFDAIIKAALDRNRVSIIKWLIVDYGASVTAEWLCLPRKERTGPNVYDEAILPLLLSNIPISVIEEAYPLSNIHSEYLSIRVWEIILYCKKWEEIDWKKMFIALYHEDEALAIFLNKKIVEKNFIPLVWVKTHIENGNYSASHKVCNYFLDK